MTDYRQADRQIYKQIGQYIFHLLSKTLVNLCGDKYIHFSHWKQNLIKGQSF